MRINLMNNKKIFPINKYEVCSKLNYDICTSFQTLKQIEKGESKIVEVVVLIQ